MIMSSVGPQAGSSDDDPVNAMRQAAQAGQGGGRAASGMGNQQEQQHGRQKRFRGPSGV
jgi:hypothetical protein